MHELEGLAFVVDRMMRVVEGLSGLVGDMQRHIPRDRGILGRRA